MVQKRKYKLTPPRFNYKDAAKKLTPVSERMSVSSLEVGKIYCFDKNMESPYGWDVTNYQSGNRLPNGMDRRLMFDQTAAVVFMGKLSEPYGNRHLYSFMGRKVNSQQGDEVVILAFETFVVECLMKEVL